MPADQPVGAQANQITERKGKGMETREARTWKKLGSAPGPDLRIFQSRFDRLENPRNAQCLDALVLEANDWVNVVALTTAGRVVLVEQFRFGAGTVSLEVPAGVVETGESPLEAAKRELLEETGYVAEGWASMGSVEANPAFMDNTCHLWLATSAVKTGDQCLDTGEDIVAMELSPEALQEAIQSDRLRNALSLLALSRVFDLRQR